MIILIQNINVKISSPMNSICEAIGEPWRQHSVILYNTQQSSMSMNDWTCKLYGGEGWHHCFFYAIYIYTGWRKIVPLFKSYYTITNYIKGSAHLIKNWFIKLFTYYFKYYLWVLLWIRQMGCRVEKKFYFQNKFLFLLALKPVSTVVNCNVNYYFLLFLHW